MIKNLFYEYDKIALFMNVFYKRCKVVWPTEIDMKRIEYINNIPFSPLMDSAGV